MPALRTLRPALQFPQFANPLCYHLQTFQFFRSLERYAPQLYLVPDHSNVAVIGKGIFQHRVSLWPRSYLWALSGSSSEAEGFKVQIRDLGSKGMYFSNPVKFENCTGQGTTQGITHPLFILPRPLLVIAPAMLSVQIENLSASTNTIQLVLFTSEPEHRS